jgi:hypothetical protein
MTHLWEVNHPYYGSAAWIADMHDEYDSFEAFLDSEGQADMDYNCLVRWDWREGEEWDLPAFNGDKTVRNGMLCLYFFQQRKGYLRSIFVKVARWDEEQVRDYLLPRFAYLKELWLPLGEAYAQSHTPVSE